MHKHKKDPHPTYPARRQWLPDDSSVSLQGGVNACRVVLPGVQIHPLVTLRATHRHTPQQFIRLIVLVGLLERLLTAALLTEAAKMWAATL